MLNQRMLINGKWVNSFTNNKITVTNPADGNVFATVPNSAPEDISLAIEAAHASFESWANLTSFQRGKYLRDASELITKRSKEIASLMTKEQGKPLAEATGEVLKGAEILKYYAEEGERIYGRIIPGVKPNETSSVIYQPVGPAAAIVPWNYPVELLAWKVGAALAAGCTIVVKIPSITPLSPLKFLECLVDVGVPNGTVNAITGPGSVIGKQLVESPKIKKVAFTGSTKVGKTVLANSVSTLKKVSLELGGSLPMIICADCNLEEAVKGAVRRSFRNMGQICIAVNRIYVDKKIYPEFIKKFVDKTKELVIGDGMTDNCDVGPMCTKSGLETAQDHIKDAVDNGAVLHCGGQKPKDEKFVNGNFFEPTILGNVTHEMKIMQEETFGPAVGVMPFDEIDEAIALANDSPYGLAAIIYTENMSIANKLSLAIDSGNVSINNPDPGVINAPYGGWKDSGFGHEHGPEGLYEYLNIKHIHTRYL